MYTCNLADVVFTVSKQLITCNAMFKTSTSTVKPVSAAVALAYAAVSFGHLALSSTKWSVQPQLQMTSSGVIHGCQTRVPQWHSFIDWSCRTATHQISQSCG